MRTHIRRFKLSDTFIDQYRDREVPWGPLGMLRLSGHMPADSMSLTRATGTEEWFQTCRRVIEGMFEMQKQHVLQAWSEWNDQESTDAPPRMHTSAFYLKWTPPVVAYG